METIINKNISSNVVYTKFYVCPTCNNIIQSLGDATICCCGNDLMPLKAEEIDEKHQFTVEKVEDEIFISSKHSMTKEHYISFVAYVTGEKIQFVKLYPEGNAEARIEPRGRGYLYSYCNKHGLMKQKI